jgi:hypothetical protein
MHSVTPADVCEHGSMNASRGSFAAAGFTP